MIFLLSVLSKNLTYCTSVIDEYNSTSHCGEQCRDCGIYQHCQDKGFSLMFVKAVDKRSAMSLASFTCRITPRTISRMRRKDLLKD